MRGEPGPQPPKHHEIGIPGSLRIRTVGKRAEHLRVTVRRQLLPRLKDTDDDAHPAPDRDLPAERAFGASKMLLAEMVADHDDVVSALNILPGEKPASERRNDSHHRQEIWGYAHDAALDRITADRDVGHLVAAEAVFREHIGLRTVGAQIGIPEHSRRLGGFLVTQADQIDVRRKPVRPEQNPVNDTEYSGGRSYAERERKDRHEREAPRPAKGAHHVAKVGEHLVGASAPGVSTAPLQSQGRYNISGYSMPFHRRHCVP